MVWLVFQAVDFADVALARQALGTAWDPFHLASLVVFSVAFAFGIRTKDRAFHGALAIAWLLDCLWMVYMGFSEPILVP